MKLATVSKEAGNIDFAAGAAEANNAPAGADKDSVNAIIEGVKTILEIAEKSAIKLEKGDSGNIVANANGPKLLAHNSRAVAGDAAKLADEVSKADPWAMIDKIRNATALEMLLLWTFLLKLLLVLKLGH